MKTHYDGDAKPLLAFFSHPLSSSQFFAFISFTLGVPLILANFAEQTHEIKASTTGTGCDC